MTTISLLNGHVFSFVLIIITVVIILSIYTMIKPESTIPYNFDPFPEISPTDLPDNSHLTENCWNSLTPCDKDGECIGCGSDYVCTTLTDSDAPHYFNGIPIPKNRPYCLKKKENDRQCNTFTGRWLWVNDPDYCNDIKPGSTQCWKCECVYPDFFNGEACVEQQVCQNRSQFVSSKEFQAKNILVATEHAPPSLKGKVWDPISGKDSDILLHSPMTTTSDGKPWFACQCNSSEDGQFFTKLPNDPYTCHLDPCFGYLGWETPPDHRLQCSGNDCKCDCSVTGMATSPGGKWKGTCVSVSDSCGHYGWDNNSQKCICDVNQGVWPLKCRSSLINSEDTSLPKCLNYTNNALGYDCRNPCEDPNNSCFHGGACQSLGPSKAKCDCTFAKHDGDFIWTGKRCEKECLPDGVAISTGGVSLPTSNCYNCQCCCAKSFDHVYGSTHLTWTDLCSGGYYACPGPVGGPGTDSGCQIGESSNC